MGVSRENIQRPRFHSQPFWCKSVDPTQASGTASSKICIIEGSFGRAANVGKQIWVDRVNPLASFVADGKRLAEMTRSLWTWKGIRWGRILNYAAWYQMREREKLLWPAKKFLHSRIHLEMHIVMQRKAVKIWKAKMKDPYEFNKQVTTRFWEVVTPRASIPM